MEGMCFDCKLPFSTLSLIIVADYDLTFFLQQKISKKACVFVHSTLFSITSQRHRCRLSEWEGGRESFVFCWKDVTRWKWPIEHVYAITCRLIIFFSSSSFSSFFSLFSYPTCTCIREAIEPHMLFVDYIFLAKLKISNSNFFLSLSLFHLMACV